MKEEKKIGFYKERGEERAVKINYIKELTIKELGEKIFSIILDRGEYRQIVVFQDEIDGMNEEDNWDCMFITQPIPMDRIRIKENKHTPWPYVCFEYKEEGYWAIKDKRDKLNEIKKFVRGLELKGR